MAKLFPKEHVLGFLSSIALTIAALMVLYLDVSFGVKMTILLVTAGLQASLQLFLFMHVSESSDKHTVYLNIIFAIFIALVIVFGTLFTMIWGHAGH